MGKSKKQYAGTKYSMGMHMVLCKGPVDSIKQISADNKLLYAGTLGAGELEIIAPTFWGGEKREGGIEGVIEVMMGEDTQPPNSYLQSIIGDDIPAFRGVVSLLWNSLYYSMNPYVKPWAVVVRRLNVLSNGVAQWYPSKVDIAGDMNPAHMIKESLNDNDWGLGYPDTELDLPSFVEAADRLHSEQIGLSMILDSEGSILSFIEEVLEHVSGRLYVSPTTGLFTLKLIRKDYDVATIPLLDESNIKSIDSFERKTWHDTVNQINVTFLDRETWKEQTITVHDLGNIESQSALVSRTQTYRGATNAALASRLATRDLALLSKSLRKLSITCLRSAFDLEAGDVFKFSWASLFSENVPYRIIEVDYGDFRDSYVKIVAIEDAISMPGASESLVDVQPEDTDYLPDLSSEGALSRVDELTHWQMHQEFSQADINALPTDPCHAGILSQNKYSHFINFQVYKHITGNYAYDFDGDFCTTGRLSSALTVENVSTVQAETEIAQVVGNLPTHIVGVGGNNPWEAPLTPGGTEILGYAYIGQELVHITRVESVPNGVGSQPFWDPHGATTARATTFALLIQRGMFDTVPMPHAAGTRIWFIEDYHAVDPETYVTGDDPYYKTLAVTGAGKEAESTAGIVSVTMEGRASLPLPPGNIRVDLLVHNPTPVGAVTVTLDWFHRDKDLQTSEAIITQDHSHIGNGAGFEYILQVEDSNGTILRGPIAIPEAAASTPTYDLDMTATDITVATTNNAVVVKVWTKHIASGLVSRVPNITTIYK